MPGPLQGLRVLEIATIIAAPSAAALLAEYGADVVKAELPGAGDCARSSGTPPPWHLAREAIQVIIRLAGQAPIRRFPLSANAKP